MIVYVPMRMSWLHFWAAQKAIPVNEKSVMHLTKYNKMLVCKATFCLEYILSSSKFIQCSFFLQNTCLRKIINLRVLVIKPDL